MIGEIDKDLRPQQPEIYLCKPNRERVAFLKEAKSIKMSLKYNDIHELTLELPTKIKKNHQNVENPHIDLILGRYLLEVGDEFFIIHKFDKNASRDGENLSLSAYHQPYELRDKVVRGYKGIKTLTQSMTDTLVSQTTWRIDYCDADFDIRTREFDVQEETILEFIFNTAKKFRAVVYWDSKNRRVSFYKQENLGNDKGLYINDKKYLKNIMDVTDFETVCTRLRLFGKDGMSIHQLNPTGQNFIENFSYFMYPYQEDANGNRITSSRYMTDGLCHAILEYRKFIASNNETFSTLVSDRNTLQSEMSALKVELEDLNGELTVIWDGLDVANAAGNPTGGLVGDKYDKQQQITNKEQQITDKQLEIDAVDLQIATLKNGLQEINFFTPEQILEKNSYEIYRTFDNSSYFNMSELLQAGQEELQKLIYPPINISVGLVNFLQVVKAQNDWHRFKIGDIITLTYPNFGISIKAKIHTIDIDYDSNDINVTISDFKRLLTDRDYFDEMFYRNSSTSAQVEFNKQWWEIAEDNDTFVRKLLEEGWDANALAINSGGQDEVTLSSRGLLIRDLNDPLNYLIARHGIIAITNDGGNTWKNALTKGGVIAERLYGQIIAGEDLTITTLAGDFTVNSHGMTAVDMDLTVTNTAGTSRIVINTTDGIKVESNTGGGWEDKLTIDPVTGDITIDGNIKRGSGNNVFKATKRGIQLGSDDFDDAPFRVDTAGNMISTGANIIATSADGRSRAVLNSEKLSFQALGSGGSMEDKVFFDPNIGRYVFDGILSAQALEAVSANIDVVVSETVIVNNLYAQKGFVAELTVNHLLTADFTSGATEMFFIDIVEDRWSFVQAYLAEDGGTRQLTSLDGALMYWVEESQKTMSAEITDWPVMVPIYDMASVMTIEPETFTDDVGPVRGPAITFGRGDGVTPTSSKGKIYKDRSSLSIEYAASNTGDVAALKVGDHGVTVENANGNTNIRQLRNSMVVNDLSEATEAQDGDIVFVIDTTS